ncbi:hypothetical protein ACNVED_12045 [Legionella sp. D16C41]|uniref:hypothetical protein n=1 Tax=Legionella sp. D16C41 TaxID=3402688 RepID=UPI003AF821BE
MKHIQLPALSNRFAHLWNTKWIVSETYLDKNNIDSQLCFLECDSELTAKSIAEHTPLGRSLPGREDVMPLYVSGKYVFASRGLLENFFAGNYVSTPDKEEISYYISPNNKVIKLILKNKPIAIEDEEENYLDSFWGAKKAKVKTENPIISGYFYNNLFLTDYSQILWLESPTYQGKKMLSAYGLTDSQEVGKLKKIILQDAAKKAITVEPNALGSKQNILVVPVTLMNKIYGKIELVNLCNSYSKYGFEDKSADTRASYIQHIFLKWDQSKSTEQILNLPNRAHITSKNYSPAFFNSESLNDFLDEKTSETLSSQFPQ